MNRSVRGLSIRQEMVNECNAPSNFIIDGYETRARFREHGTVPYSNHCNPSRFLDIAKHFGVPLEHACGGSCSCIYLPLIINEGAENRTVSGRNERTASLPLGLTAPLAPRLPAVHHGDVVCSCRFPPHYGAEGGGIQLGKSTRTPRRRVMP